MKLDNYLLTNHRGGNGWWVLRKSYPLEQDSVDVTPIFGTYLIDSAAPIPS